MRLMQLKRTAYLGLVNVIRNSFVSFSVIFVMTVTLFIVGASLLFGKVVDDVTRELKDKVDVTVYFIPNTPEEQIAEFRQQLLGLSQVREVLSVSQDIALQEYREKHKNDPDVLAGLDLLEANPFRARLSIRAKDSGDFEAISKFLKQQDILSDNPTTVIEKIDYYQNREIIERLTSVVDTAVLFTRGFILLLIIISLLIVSNIVRLIIYLSREEIKVMRLIGAEDWYVRAPFLISGAIYGLIGSLIAVILLYPSSLLISEDVKQFFGGQGIFDHYVAEFFTLTLTLTLIGCFIGSISSYLTTEKYLDD